MSRKNILFYERNVDGTIGGSYFSLLYLTRGLDRSRFNPVVVFHNHHALLEEYDKAGVKTLIIPPYQPVVLKSEIKLLNSILKIIQKLRNAMGFLVITSYQSLKLMKQYDIDLLHLNNTASGGSNWIIAAFLLKVPCISHERVINTHFSLLPRLLTTKLKAIICISKYVRTVLEAKNIESEKLVTIYNGIDPDEVQLKLTGKDVLQVFNIPSDATVIGVIGNIKEWKGQIVAVRAMRKIVDSYPDAICMLVGDTAEADQYYEDSIRKLIQELGLESNIIFTGYTTNVPDYLNILKVILHTSIHPEPFGRVLIEAMSLSKPIVAANDGAIPEIIEDGVSGLTFRPGDHDHLADRVLTLLADIDYAEKLGRNGYVRLLDNFHIDKNIEKTQILYEEIFSNA
jgi:glycosyltransferase involved in cell wall biosynthesis